MLNLFAGIWRRAPKRLKRWTVRLSHPRFAVTAAGVITDSQGRVLLLKHRFRPGSGWGLPGGFIEKDEQPDEALRRELREEIGLELGNLKLIFSRAFTVPQQVEIVFQGGAVGDAGRLSSEIEKASWFSPSELPTGLPKDQAQIVKRALTDGASVQD